MADAPPGAGGADSPGGGALLPQPLDYILLCGVCVALYFKTLGYGFILSWDDAAYGYCESTLISWNRSCGPCWKCLGT